MVEHQSTHRLSYIDALRGFTMFLVVYWHVMALSLGITVGESVVGKFFLTFRMPMFFFISGYFGYKVAQTMSFGQYKNLIKKKTFIQLIPTFIFFSLFCVVNNRSPLVFFKEGLTGYWFTLVLFELFVIQYTLTLLSDGLKFDRKYNIIALIVLSLLGNLIALWINTRPVMPKISLVLTLNNLFYYFQFFALGCLVKQYPSIKEKITSPKSLTIFTVMFVLIFIFITKWTSHDDTVINKIIYYGLDSIIIKYCGLIMVFSIFARSKDYFAQNGRISKFMQFTGRRTLDIYLLHYFFLPKILIYKHLFINGGGENIIAELVIISFIALCIICICLLISICLRQSPMLAKYLFGILPKRDNNLQINR